MTELLETIETLLRWLSYLLLIGVAAGALYRLRFSASGILLSAAAALELMTFLTLLLYYALDLDIPYELDALVVLSARVTELLAWGLFTVGIALIPRSLRKLGERALLPPAAPPSPQSASGAPT